MNKIIATALLLSAGTALSNADTISPLTDNGGLTGTWSNVEGTIDYTTGTWTGLPNWQVYNATYTLNDSISLAQGDTLDFSYVLTSISNGNIVLDVSFVGSSQAGAYSTLVDGVQIGLSDNVSAGGYAFSGTNDASVAQLSSYENLSGALPTDGTATTISGHIAWSGDSNGFVLTIGSSATNDTATLTLGDTVEVSKLVLTMDGWNTTALNGTMSNIQMTYTTAAIPEPSAFGLLAGAGALALVAARRRRSRKA